MNKNGMLFLPLFTMLLFLTGCSSLAHLTATETPRQRFWGSYTEKRTYSFDGKYFADQKAVDGMIKVTVYLASSKEAVCEFVPARSMDFYGICWERDTYTLWTQSADIGSYGYELHDGVWERNERLEKPAYIISRWDEEYRNNSELWDTIYMSPTD